MKKGFLTKSISMHVSEQGETTGIPHVMAFPIVNNRIMTLVYVGTDSVLPNKEGDGINLETVWSKRPFRAIWDTGAVNTVIEPRVIEELDLSPEGFRTMRGIDGIEKDREIYRILVILTKNPITPEANQFPNLITLHPVVAGKLEEDGQLGGDIDVLIGMDVIQRLDFAISTGIDGNVWCSIRHPASGFRIFFDGVD